MIYKLIILVKFAWQSLQKINRAHIGRKAVYRGEKVRLRNGVCHPYWSAESLETGAQYKRLHLLELDLDRSLKSQIKAFRFHFNWLMGYHFKAEVQRLKTPHHSELRKKDYER